MAKKMLLIIATFLSVIVPASSTSAKTTYAEPLSAGPSGTYATQLFCTNIGNTATTAIQIKFYASDSSTLVLSYTDISPLAAGVTRNYYTPTLSPSLPSSFNGSAVINSDQPLECNDDTEAVASDIGTAADPARYGSAGGVDENNLGTTLYASQVMANYSGWNSYIAVQNAESTSITVNVSYVDRYGTAYPAANESINIPAHSNHIFYQQNNSILPNPFMGGAKLMGTGRMAAIVNFYDSNADYTTSQFNSYNAVANGANKLIGPTFYRNFYDYQGGISVQNIGTSNTTVTITFAFAGNTYSYNTGTIVPDGTYDVYAKDIAALAPVDSLPVPNRTGSLVLQADPGGMIIANINADNRGICYTTDCGTVPANAPGQSVSYTAVPDGTQTNTIYFVAVPRHVGTADFSGGYAFGNTTAIPTTCNITFPTAPAANQTGVTLGANGFISVFAPDIPNLPDGYYGSVIATCGEPIVGISNVSARNPAYLGDSWGQSNGYNR